MKTMEIDKHVAICMIGSLELYRVLVEYYQLMQKKPEILEERVAHQVEMEQKAAEILMHLEAMGLHLAEISQEQWQHCSQLLENEVTLRKLMAGIHTNETEN